MNVTPYGMFFYLPHRDREKRASKWEGLIVIRLLYNQTIISISKVSI